MEVLCGIRQIKCYAWEAVFAGKARSGMFFLFLWFRLHFFLSYELSCSSGRCLTCL